MRNRPRPSLIIAVLVSAAALAWEASASILGEENGPLLGILSNGLKQLAALNEQLGEVRKTYQATKTLAGYAADAKNGFAALIALDFNRLEQLFITAVPNAAFFDLEARYGYHSWGQGSGELQLMIRQCMNFQASQAAAAAAQPQPPAPVQAGAPGPVLYDPCAVLNARLTGAELTSSLSRLFGPAGIPEAVQPAIVAATNADRQQVRDLARQQKIAALRALCEDAPTADADKCKAATAAAQILAADQFVELTDRMADLNRVEATRLALEVAGREQQRQQEEAQRTLLLDAASHVAPPPVRVHAPSFDFSE